MKAVIKSKKTDKFGKVGNIYDEDLGYDTIFLKFNKKSLTTEIQKKSTKLNSQFRKTTCILLVNLKMNIQQIVLQTLKKADSLSGRYTSTFWLKLILIDYFYNQFLWSETQKK